MSVKPIMSQPHHSWRRLCLHTHPRTEVAAISPQKAIIKNLALTAHPRYHLLTNFAGSHCTSTYEWDCEHWLQWPPCECAVCDVVCVMCFRYLAHVAQFRTMEQDHHLINESELSTKACSVNIFLLAWKCCLTPLGGIHMASHYFLISNPLLTIKNNAAYYR